MIFSQYSDFVLRLIGDLNLAVNIKNNSVYEIDEVAKLYIEFAKMNNGNIDECYFATKNNKSIEIIHDEILSLIDILNTH
jgi:hypothetical protein